MISKTAWSLFLTGLVLGYGPCLLSCGPMLVSYIAATKEGPAGGLRTYAIFALTKILVYLALGVLVGFFGEFVLHRLFESAWLKFFYFGFGVFLFILGVLLCAEKFPWGKKCSGWFGAGGQKDIKNIIVFGLVVSFSPCWPLLAVLGYIALISDHWTKGLLYMGSFGLGTVISPMIVLSMAAGWIARVLHRHERILRLTRIFCGAILCYLGFALMLLLKG